MVDEREKKVILLVACLASFLVPYTGSSITVAFPAIADQFGADAVTLGWITSAYIVSAALFIVPFGRLADILGRKKIFVLGILIFTLASLASAFAPASGVLIAARFIQGIGGAMLFATSVAMVTQVYGPGERGRALGITIATVYAGLSIGPFLGGILTDHFGWPAIFLINVPLGIATIVLTLKGVSHEWADATGERFDLYGAVLYGIMIFGAIFGISLLPAAAAGLWIFISGCTLAVFIWWEKRCTSPLLDLAIFSDNNTFLFSNIAAMINYGATFAVAVLLSLYLQYIRGFSAETAGFILVAQPVVQMIFSPFAGNLSDRIEPRIVATMGMAITADRALVFYVPHPCDISLCDCHQPDGSWLWICTFFVTEYQCNHEFSPYPLSRHSVKYGLNNAIARAGNLNGDRHVLLFGFYRERRDYSLCLS